MSILDSVNDVYSINEPFFDKESYVEWLESFTIDERVSDDERLTYKKLIKKLWLIPYISSIGNDDDRAIDGIELRNRYYDILAKDTGVHIDDIENVEKIFGPCRVLEMLVALSMQMYDLMQDIGEYNSVSRWFWEIMYCVGFDILDDNYWNSVVFDDIGEYVNKTCHHIMEQDGPRVGKRGGWFKLYDWENREIWYQMHAYLKPYIMNPY